MPRCGSQCYLCDLPVRFDTYVGCTHGCKYCFVQRKGELAKIEKGESPRVLRDWINGKRNIETRWVDWDIPLHWGGMSDPFQPIEREWRISYKCLEIFRETQYPFLVSSKGKLMGEDEYVDIISDCNVVVQISAVCDSFNELEPGCPSYRDRLAIAEKFAKRGKRVIIRIQPYMHEVYEEVKACLKDVAAAGVYGVVIEGMKHSKHAPGLVKVGIDWCIDYKTIKSDFLELQEEGHKHGLKVYAGENRIRELGDSLTCCGTDGMEGFVPNKFNVNHFVRGEYVEPTAGQLAIGSAGCFSTLNQTTAGNRILEKNSFATAMATFAKEKRSQVVETFGLDLK